MKVLNRSRRLSTVFNLETEPIHFSNEELADLYALRPSGLTEPAPLFSQSRIVGHSFQGWPLMIILMTLFLGVAAVAAMLGEQVFGIYVTRLMG